MSAQDTLTSHEYLNRNARLWYWRREGTDDRKWVIFLHGGGGNHNAFEFQLQAFDERWNLILVDMRGSGASKEGTYGEVDFVDIVDDVSRLFELEDIPQAVLIGHSFGSHVAQDVALLHPERVSGMVLIGNYDQHRAVSDDEQARVIQVTEQVRALPWPEFVTIAANMSTEVPELRQRIEQSLLGIDQDTYLQLGISRSKAQHEVASYPHPVPTLVISGENEYDAEDLKVAYAGLMAKNPLCRSIVLTDTGHMVHMEKVSEVNGLITDFVEGLPAG